MSFVKIIEEILNETTVIGGSGSCMGSGVTKTSTPFSKDGYASKDMRTPKSLYGYKVITRFTKKKKNRK
jgi:hypothetical protein